MMLDRFCLTFLKKKWPSEGWDDISIELLLKELSIMDSNNFPGNRVCVSAMIIVPLSNLGTLIPIKFQSMVFFFNVFNHGHGG